MFDSCHQDFPSGLGQHPSDTTHRGEYALRNTYLNLDIDPSGSVTSTIWLGNVSSSDDQCKDGSYVRNCLLHPRKDATEPMFEIPAGGAAMITRLDRYAIIPLERYELMLELAKKAKDFCEAFLQKYTGP